MKTIDGREVLAEYLGDVDIRHLLDNITNVNTNYVKEPRAELIDGKLTGAFRWVPHSLYRLPHGEYMVSVETDIEGNILEVVLTREQPLDRIENYTLASTKKAIVRQHAPHQNRRPASGGKGAD